VRGTKYTARYGVHPVQFRGHIDWDNQDVVGNDARSDMAYGLIMWYIAGPSLVIGANDACVVTTYIYTAVLKVLVYKDEYGKFQCNGLGPTDVPAISFPTQYEGPCIPEAAVDNANASASGGIDPQVRVNVLMWFEGLRAT